MKTRMKPEYHSLIYKASIGYNDSWSMVDQEVLEKFADLVAIEETRMCRDMFMKDSISWKLMNDRMEAKIRQYEFGPD